MFRNFGIPALAFVGLIFALIMVVIGLRKPPIPPIDHPPPTPPYAHYVAGSGVIEASSLDVNLGTAVDGIVEDVFVQPGDRVKKGVPLFRIDTRDLLARQKEADATRLVVAAQFERLLAEPRPEEVPPLEARVKRAQSRLSDEEIQYELFRNVSDKRAISLSQFTERKYAAGVAKYELKQAQADLDLLKAGAWVEDLKISSQRLDEAQSSLDLATVLLERATVRAPFDGQVLQININKGDFARGSREDTIFQDAIMVFGKVNPLHVRIDVDENDAWRVFPNARATAFVRGDSSINFPLKFVRIDPYILPKRNLTGENIERVDTRVLQLIYQFEKGDLPVYVGQLLDIYVEAKPSQGLQ